MLQRAYNPTKNKRPQWENMTKRGKTGEDNRSQEEESKEKKPPNKEGTINGVIKDERGSKELKSGK